ncbi:MAG: hypothetical protein ABSF81_13495 [Bacteroidales bacterium]
MSKENKGRFEVTEMFTAKACKNKIFGGIITRMVDDNGNPVVFSRLLMDDDGLLCARAENQKILGKNLDEMCRMICYEGLHDDRGVTKKIFGADLFLN